MPRLMMNKIGWFKGYGSVLSRYSLHNSCERTLGTVLSLDGKIRSPYVQSMVG